MCAWLRKQKTDIKIEYIDNPYMNCTYGCGDDVIVGKRRKIFE